MPRKGMRSLCFSPKIPSFSSTPPPSPSRFGFSPSRPTFSHSVMDRALEMAEPLIQKWDPESTTFARVTSLFYESRQEARDFIKTVNNLQRAMHFLADDNSTPDKLARAQLLMQIAMKRLQKELYQILSTNRAHLDPESVSTRSSRTSTTSSSSFDDDNDDDDVIRAAADDHSISEAEDASFLAMSDLRLIAECMISSGYAKECLKIYKIIRKSIVDEGIYRLGVEKFSSSQIHKMSWESLEMRIGNWLNAVRTAVKTLFNGERILCDHVFASSDSLRESCFAEITREGATILFAFPENAARHTKKSPEKIFRFLDMYDSISGFWPDIDLIFSGEATAGVKSQALTSLVRLGEFARAALADFESAVLKESPKSLVAGAGIHDLTIDAAGYIANLADYSSILSDILADSPPPKRNALPESYFGFSDSDESPLPALSLKMAWLVLVVLCKLDAKAKHYREISQSYLFLANNLQYVVGKVRTSNLKYLLGDEWLARHESKVKQFASKYERLGWGHVIDSVPTDPAAADAPPAEIKEVFKRFNAAFDQAYKKQAVCVVPDSKLRDHIKVSIARKIFRLYREFYNENKHKVERERFSASVVRYTPEDVGHHLSDMFFGNLELESSSSSPSPSHSHFSLH